MFARDCAHCHRETGLAVERQPQCALNPGAQWAADGPANTNRMRLCFGSATRQEIREGVAKLAEVCRREFGVPVRSANKELG